MVSTVTSGKSRWDQSTCGKIQDSRTSAGRAHITEHGVLMDHHVNHCRIL